MARIGLLGGGLSTREGGRRSTKGAVAAEPKKKAPPLSVILQDARELAQVLRDRGACEDAGEVRLLRRYERARREQVLAMTAVTDGLQRLFNNRLAPLMWLRNRGLNLVDRVAPLKHLLIRQAMG